MTDRLIPQQWVTVPLEEVILRIVGGGTPSKSKPAYYQGEIPWMSVKDMNKHVLEDTVDHISQAAVDNSSTNLIPAGTPIIATRMSLGKIVVANFDSAINQDLKALFLPAKIHRDYLVYWYRSVARTIEQMGTGTTVKGIRLEVLKGLQFSLPPLAEQKVIADKLDTLLAQVENTKARLERIPRILKRFRQSVLAAAVSGRLTEEWRNQNRASITDWDALSVGDVATVATGKTPSRKEPNYWKDGDVPWLTSASTGAIYTDSAEQFVTKAAVDKCSLKVFPPGTLLLAMYGEGKTRGQITELRLSATCNQACAAVTANRQKILRSYLKLRLLENYEETRKAAAGGAQPNLNLNKVREIEISVPDKDEQTEIVRQVDQLFAHADRIEQQVNNALARVNNLTQSILAKAFRGELTEQWRKDNPELISGENSAEALLERIRAERAELKPAKKTRKKVSS